MRRRRSTGTGRSPSSSYRPIMTPSSSSAPEADHILAYLVKPIKQSDLEPAIGIVIRRFAQFQAMRREADDLKQAMEDRKLVERAKGLLMKKASLDEAEAFQRLQKMASEQNRKLAEVAGMLLTAQEAFDPPKPVRRQGRR